MQTYVSVKTIQPRTGTADRSTLARPLPRRLPSNCCPACMKRRHGISMEYASSTPGDKHEILRQHTCMRRSTCSSRLANMRTASFITPGAPGRPRPCPALGLLEPPRPGAPSPKGLGAPSYPPLSPIPGDLCFSLHVKRRKGHSPFDAVVLVQSKLCYYHRVYLPRGGRGGLLLDISRRVTSRGRCSVASQAVVATRTAKSDRSRKP